MKNILTIGILCMLSLSQLAKSQVTNYEWAETVPESPFYEVKVYYGEDEYEIHTHISKPNLNIDPLHPTEGNGVTNFMEDRSLSYVLFSFEGEITIEVTKKFGGPAPRVVIAPKIFGINPTYFDGKTVRFTLTQEGESPRYISVNFDSPDNKDDDTAGGKNILNGMMIFAERPETYTPYSGNPGVVKYSNDANLNNADVIYFEPGDYDLTERFNTVPGQIGSMPLTKDRQRVYLAGGAFVRGTFNAEGHDNIWLYGRGIITGQDMAWHWIRDDKDKKEAFVNFLGVDNAHIEGVVIENPTHHTIPSSSNTYFKNLKIIGWASNHDGIRPGNNAVADGIFIKTSDDYDYARSPHLVKNSVFWPMTNGATGQLGWNNLGTGYAVYKNNVLINSEWRNYNRNRGFIGSVLEQGVKLQNDSVIDLTCEDFTAMIANITIKYESSGDPLSEGAGEIKNFYFKNIKMEQPFLYPSGAKQKQLLSGFVENGYTASVHDFKFVNIVAGNTLVTNENYTEYFDLDPATTYNISFETEGDIYLIRTYATPGGAFIPEGIIEVPEGTSQVVNIVPDPGKKIVDVLINGVSQGRMQTVAFQDVQQSNIIEVIFGDGDDYFGMAPEGIKNNNLVSDLVSVFPNPSKYELRVKLSNSMEINSLELCTLAGQKLLVKTDSKKGEFLMDISELEPAVYILKISTSQGVISKAIMKI